MLLLVSVIKNAMREAPSWLHTIPTPLLFLFPGSGIKAALNLCGLCLRLCFNIRLKRVLELKPKVQMMLWCFYVLFPYSSPQKLHPYQILIDLCTGQRGKGENILVSKILWCRSLKWPELEGKSNTKKWNGPECGSWGCCAWQQAGTTVVMFITGCLGSMTAVALPEFLFHAWVTCRVTKDLFKLMVVFK